jgi:D-tyrosyl-tRNA(Tyr) deacylase
MKAVAVRVNNAAVYLREAQEPFSTIGKGVVVFLGFAVGDDDTKLERMAEKLANLRIFEEQGKLANSLKEKGYAILCIPNFSVCANIKKGRRPSFEEVMPPAKAKIMFDDFILLLKARLVLVCEAKFGANMRIKLESDGPLNLIIEI